MTKRVFLAGLLACLCGAVPAIADDAGDAKKAVEAWLALHDSGNYGDTWDASAKLVKEQVPKQQWEKTMRSVLEPFGELMSRSLLSSAAKSELPGMADGHYFVFAYKAEFQNKESAIETIIPMLEDGRWKVMTYRIR